MSKNAKKQMNLLFGYPLIFQEPPVPAADNQPVCPFCKDRVEYKGDELECVHGHRFWWIMSGIDSRFHAVLSNEQCLDYWLMSRWGMIQQKGASDV